MEHCEGQRISLTSALFARAGYSGNAAPAAVMNPEPAPNGTGMGAYPGRGAGGTFAYANHLQGASSAIVMPGVGGALGKGTHWRPEAMPATRVPVSDHGTSGHYVHEGSVAPGVASASSSRPGMAVNEQLHRSSHVVWGAIEHESQDSLATSYNTDGLQANQYQSGSRKKIQNKRITPEGVLFLDSMSSIGSGISEDGMATQNSSSPSTHRYTFSAQPFHQPYESASQALGAEDGCYSRPHEGAADDFSSGGESEEGVNQRQEQLALQRAWEAENIDIEALLAQVPLDEDGRQTSVGSIGHACGECKAPCSFVQRARGCVNGVNCGFCHFSHKMKRQRPKKQRPRPCKGKRDKYRKHWEELRTQVEENPGDFDPESVELPTSISTYAKLKAKLITRLQTHKSNVLAERDSGEPSGHRESQQREGDAASGHRDLL